MKIKVVSQDGYVWNAATKYAAVNNCLPVYSFTNEKFIDNDTYYLIWAHPKALNYKWFNNVINVLSTTSYLGFMPCSNPKEANINYKKSLREFEAQNVYVFSTLVEKSDTFNSSNLEIHALYNAEKPTYSAEGNNKCNLYIIAAHGSYDKIYISDNIEFSDSTSTQKIYKQNYHVNKIESEIIFFDVCQMLKFNNFDNTLVRKAYLDNPCSHVIASTLSKDSGYPEIAFCITLLNSGLKIGHAVAMINQGEAYYFKNTQSFYLLGNPLTKLNQFQNNNSIINVEHFGYGKFKLNIRTASNLAFGVVRNKVTENLSDGWKSYSITNIIGFKYMYIWIWSDQKERYLNFFYWYTRKDTTPIQVKATITLDDCIDKRYDCNLIDFYKKYYDLCTVIDNISCLSTNCEVHKEMDKYKLFLISARKFKYEHKFSIVEMNLYSIIKKKFYEIDAKVVNIITILLRKELEHSYHGVLFDERKTFADLTERIYELCPYCFCKLTQKKFTPFFTPKNVITRLECPQCGIIEEYTGNRIFRISFESTVNNKGIITITNKTSSCKIFDGLIFIATATEVSFISKVQSIISTSFHENIVLNEKALNNKSSHFIIVLLSDGKLMYAKVPINTKG